MEINPRVEIMDGMKTRALENHLKVVSGEINKVLGSITKKCSGPTNKSYK